MGINKRKKLKTEELRTPEFEAYLKTLPKIYLVACWYHYGVMEFAFSGKYVQEGNEMIPLVWQYDDRNGTCDNYYLRKITYTTTSFITGWFFEKYKAERVANGLELLNRKDEQDAMNALAELRRN